MSKQERYAGASALQGLSLGQQSAYISQYTPALLQPVPRSLNRDDLGLGGELPFQGCDVWTLYELSWLNAKGKPMVAVGEVSVPATSPNLIESKSFKLYLNSFNQTRCDSLEAVQAMLVKDLSACAGSDVSVTLFPLAQAPHHIAALPGECIDEQDIAVDCYEFDADLLQLSTCTCCGGRFVGHAHDPVQGYVCGLCNMPSRAGSSRKKATRKAVSRTRVAV